MLDERKSHSWWRSVIKTTSQTHIIPSAQKKETLSDLPHVEYKMLMRSTTESKGLNLSFKRLPENNLTKSKKYIPYELLVLIQ